MKRIEQLASEYASQKLNPPSPNPSEGHLDSYALACGFKPHKRGENAYSPMSPLGGVGREVFSTEGRAAREQLEWTLAYWIRK